MIRRVAFAALICLIPHAARADARISILVDFNKTNVNGAYSGIGLDWQGFEFAFDKEFRPSPLLLSGFSFGVRRELFYAFTGFGGVKDVDRWDEGTYLTFRILQNLRVHQRSIVGDWSLVSPSCTASRAPLSTGRS